MQMVNGALVVKESELNKLQELKLVKFHDGTQVVNYRGVPHPFKVETGK